MPADELSRFAGDLLRCDFSKAYAAASSTVGEKEKAGNGSSWRKHGPQLGEILRLHISCHADPAHKALQLATDVLSQVYTRLLRMLCCA